MKVYCYSGCGTCRKALQFLESNGIAFESIPIREHPPSLAELRQVLRAYGGEIRRLFNTSGLDYKKQQLKDRLPKLSEADALALLAGNGNLIKRPFVVRGATGLVGFKPDEWKAFLD